jgi:hypothetical protein
LPRQRQNETIAENRKIFMRFERCNVDRRHRNGFVGIEGETFACSLETDWNTTHRAPYPLTCEFLDVAMPTLKFGFADPWKEWVMGVEAEKTLGGLVVMSQGFRGLDGQRIPFARTGRFFWNQPEMLLEVMASKHLHPVLYSIGCSKEKDLDVSAMLDGAILRRDGVAVCWSFSPRPVWAGFEKGAWRFEFDRPDVEVLVRWQRDGATTPFAPFVSLSPELRHLQVNTPQGSRQLDTQCKHDAVVPGEALVFPAGDVMVTGGEAGGSVLREVALRRIAPDGTVGVGATRVFELAALVEAPSAPDFKPSLIRGLRSLKERIVFGVVPEDDPGEYYVWGTGTWPRCFTVSCLDRFGFCREAFEFLEFMLDASQQFLPRDGLPHLWDNFFITGPRMHAELYDINGHAMKLYEAGKFYLRHRKDDFGRKLRETHYDTLRGWCAWIERHMASDGAVLDETESNVWAHGYGTFTQAPAAAGVQLFLVLARDAGREDDVAHFAGIVGKLMQGLHTRLWGDAANPYLELPEGTGECYLGFVPRGKDERNCWGRPVQRIGLACYSLAAGFFLQDPDVGLLSPDDRRVAATLDLALRHLGDRFDERIVTWHIRRHEAHMGYGQGQVLVGLLLAGRGAEFRARLEALFDVARKEIGDPYLMQEVLGRSGNPNRGNKAHLTYFPYLAALLGGLDAPGLEERTKACLPDLVATRRGNEP